MQPPKIPHFGRDVGIVQVDYYGAPTPLRQLAGISVPESTLLVVQPYDKGAMQVRSTP